jgi:hypothetical protein
MTFPITYQITVTEKSFAPQWFFDFRTAFNVIVIRRDQQ